MADIFVSYARADRPRAERLAQALERSGWSVWWDREIPPGRSFDEVIEEALSLARCVVVVWSEASIRSEWVKTEAAEAAQRRILVPILADGARIPLEFRRIQAAAIGDWRDLEANDGWVQLCDAVAALVDSPRRAPPARVATPVRGARRPWMLAGGVALAVVVAGVYAATRPPLPAAPNATAPAVATVIPDTPTPVNPPAPAPVSAPLQRPPKAATYVRNPPEHPAETARREPVPDTPEIRPLPIENTVVANGMVNTLDREPRATTAAAFDVTLIYGVFRDQAGRLSVTPDGVRFSGTGDGSRGFELPCGSLRRVATATMIADREQRLLELSSDGQAYRVRATDTGARDSIRTAIGRTCGR